MLRFILVSKSPQRRKLLQKEGFDFEASSVSISEKLNENINLDESLKDVARRKAKAFLRQHKHLETQNILLLSADTLVFVGSHILGKPKDLEEARNHLTRLSASTHFVKTALCFYEAPKDHFLTDLVSTKITFRKLSPEDIENYVQSGEPMGKAGGYGIQGQLRIL